MCGEVVGGMVLLCWCLIDEEKARKVESGVGQKGIMRVFGEVECCVSECCVRLFC